MSDNEDGNEDNDDQAAVHVANLLIYFLCCVPAKYLLLLRGCYKYYNNNWDTGLLDNWGEQTLH